MNGKGSCLGLLAALIATGCGNATDAVDAKPARQGGDATAAATTAPARSGAATAEEVAEEARGRLRCPPSVRTAGRPANAPVDDVLGVRLGQTYDEARSLVLCSAPLLVATESRDRGFRIETHGQTLRQGFDAKPARARVDRSAREVVKDMQDEAMGRGLNRVKREIGPGESRWYVGTLGLPGDDRVISIAREEWFPEDRRPTAASLAEALATKYGTPGRVADVGSMHLYSWNRDAAGRRLVEGQPLYPVCRGNPSPDAPTNLNPDCGLTLEASVHLLPSNPSLAEYLRVSVVDQARAFAVHEATTQGLAQREDERRAREVDAAEHGAATPKL